MDQRFEQPVVQGNQVQSILKIRRIIGLITVAEDSHPLKGIQQKDSSEPLQFPKGRFKPLDFCPGQARRFDSIQRMRQQGRHRFRISLDEMRAIHTDSLQEPVRCFQYHDLGHGTGQDTFQSIDAFFRGNRSESERMGP